MVFRFLLKYLANNEQLIQRLAESYPVRKAARLCVSVFYRVKGEIGDSKLEQLRRIDGNRLRSFFSKFTDNVKKEIQDAKNQQKKM